MDYQQAFAEHYRAVRARIVNPKIKTITAPQAFFSQPEPAREPEPEPVAELPRSSDPRVNILRDCANEYGCTVADMMGNARKMKVTLARRKAMHLLWRRGTMSKAHIGRFMNKDHTTVIYALRSYEKDLAKKGEA